VGKSGNARMSRFFFSGSTVTRLDEKGRFVLPQAMRYGLVEEGQLEFTIALGLGGCLAIYRKSDIEKIIAKFQAKQHLGKYQRFFTLFFSTLHQTSCDKIGRVHLPGTLLSAIGIKNENEIVVAGVLDKIEIWPKAHYDKQMEAMLTGEHQEMMQEAFGLLDQSSSLEEELLHV
jgi:MraZ protein